MGVWWRKCLQFNVLLLLVFSGSGCGLFSLIFGGSQDADTHSHSYTVVPLERDRTEKWHLLREGKNETPEGGNDVAYEHEASGSIISMNSACVSSRKATLKELMHNLLLGLPKSKEPAARSITVDEAPALESTLDTRYGDDQPVRVRAVVLQKNGCTYDLMYIARPEYFDSLSRYFDNFVKGFHGG